MAASPSATRPIASAAALLLLLGCAQAFQTYQSKIPNGANVNADGSSWPGVGHLRSFGGGARNQFGEDFAAAGYKWTKELCEKDSDADGFSNGVELGDPQCIWQEGNNVTFDVGITHPGVCNGEKSGASKDSCTNRTMPSSLKSVKFHMNDHAVSSHHTTYDKQTFKWDDMITASGLSGTEFWGIKFEPFVDNSAVTHHMLLYGCTGDVNQKGSEAAKAQEYLNNPSEGSGGMPCTDIKYAWAVGGKSFCTPDDVAFAFDSSIKYYILETHYDNPNEVTTHKDASGLNVYLVPKGDATMANTESAGFLWLGSTPSGMQLPAKTKNALVKSEQVIPGDPSVEPLANIFAYFVHGHSYMTQVWSELHREGEYLFDVACNTQYDFDLQEFVPTEKAIPINVGDKIVSRCIYDTSSSDIPIKGGDASADEMCIIFLMYYPKVAGNTQFLSPRPTLGVYDGPAHECHVAGACGGAPEASSTAADSWAVSHGIMMIVSWCLLLPIGIAMSLFRSVTGSDGKWYRYHWMLQLAGLSVAVSAFILVVVEMNSLSGHFSGSNAAHKIIGLIVMIIAVLQPLNALIRPHVPKDGEEKTTKRKVWEVYHKNAGRLAALAAIVNCALGALAVSSNYGNSAAVFAWAAFGACLAVTLFAYAFLFAKSRSGGKQVVA